MTTRIYHIPVVPWIAYQMYHVPRCKSHFIATVDLHHVHKTQLLFVCEIEEFLIHYRTIIITTSLKILLLAPIQPGSIKEIETGSESGDRKHDNHGLEPRSVFWCLTGAEELGTDDEGCRISDKEKGCRYGSLGLAGDVCGGESKHHRQRSVGEVCAVEGYEPPSSIMSGERVHENGSDDRRNVAKELHQAARIWKVKCHESSSHKPHALRYPQRSVKQRGLEAVEAESWRSMLIQASSHPLEEIYL